MKRLLALAALAAAVALAVPASAQVYETSPYHGRVGIGWSLPQGGAADYVNDGWELTGGFGYEPLKQKWGIRVDIEWNWLDPKSQYLATSQAEDGAAGVSHLSASFLLSSSREKNFFVYGFAGCGIYREWLSLYNFTGYGYIWDPWYGWVPVPTYSTSYSNSETNFGMNLSGGINFNVGGSYGVYLEAGYHTIFSGSTNAEYVPITVGFRF